MATNPAASQAGQATGATIEYDPNATVGLATRMPDANGNVTNTSPIQSLPTNSALTLGHELIHADHIMRGNVDYSGGDHDFSVGSTQYREHSVSSSSPKQSRG
jgi:NleD-like pathogen effector protein (putative zinc metallopeptidase)